MKITFQKFKFIREIINGVGNYVSYVWKKTIKVFSPFCYFIFLLDVLGIIAIILMLINRN